MRSKSELLAGHDLVFGLVVPIGADRDVVIKALRNELSSFKYEVPPLIKLSDQIPTYVPSDFKDRARLIEVTSEARHKNSLERKDLLMRAGNAIREHQQIEEAVALIGVNAIWQGRPKGEMRMHSRRAYVIDSLKHPAEIERLRSIYGPSFVAIGIYEPPDLREKKLLKLSTIVGKPKFDYVKELMERDEDEHREFGQRLRKAFELSDIIVDTSRKKDVKDHISRLVQLLFGYPYLTPTQHEYGMFLARASQVRSGSMARQVGAAILRHDGSVVAIGTNEVARPFGGQYWEADDITYDKGRDFNRERDSSDHFRQRSITDFLKHLRDEKYLSAKLNRMEADQLLEVLFFGSELQDNKDAKEAGKRPPHRNPHKPVLKGAFLTGTIDYVRAVHAEMGAITDAARHGIGLAGHVMYTTTFPCHDCAKHIVASGITELIYLEAYPKSLVADLYDDSIDINKQRPEQELKVHFHSFVGIAPSRYLDFFAMSMERKSPRGEPVDFNASNATLRLPQYAPPPRAVDVAETEAAEDFLKRAPRGSQAIKASLKRSNPRTSGTRKTHATTRTRRRK
jgi:cytidine deaminase